MTSSQARFSRRSAGAGRFGRASASLTETGNWGRRPEAAWITSPASVAMSVPETGPAGRITGIECEGGHGESWLSGGAIDLFQGGQAGLDLFDPIHAQGFMPMRVASSLISLRPALALMRSIMLSSGTSSS